MAQNNPPAGAPVPNCVLDNNNNHIMEYNTSRLELLVLGAKLRNLLLQWNDQQKIAFRNEVGTMFREFSRAFPNANLSEFDGMRLIQDLCDGRAGAESEFALRVSPHQPLVAAFRRLKDML